MAVMMTVSACVISDHSSAAVVVSDMCNVQDVMLFVGASNCWPGAQWIVGYARQFLGSAAYPGHVHGVRAASCDRALALVWGLGFVRVRISQSLKPFAFSINPNQRTGKT